MEDGEVCVKGKERGAERQSKGGVSQVMGLLAEELRGHKSKVAIWTESSLLMKNILGKFVRFFIRRRWF